MESSKSKAIRFGVFEVDLRAGELRKDGLKVRLQEQPFRVLALLLENPGEVVTRDELREKLWSADTYVDFDKSLNTTVNKLREALGDSAENPRFVQTLHRRGYRFIAPVEGIAQESRAVLQAEAAKDGAPTGVGPTQPGHPWGSRRFLQTVIVALAVSLVVTLGVVVAMWTRSPEPIQRASIARFAFGLGSDVRDPVISPNGQHIAYIRGQLPTSKLWVQDLDREEPREIDGTEGAETPFWSPGSDFIGFGAGRKELKKVSVDGSPALVLCEIPVATGAGSAGTWSPDGAAIVFRAGPSRRSSNLYEVAANGGPPKLLVEPDEFQGRTSPYFLPLGDGRRVLMFATYSEPDEYRIVLRNLDTGDEDVLAKGTRPFYSPSGHILYETSDQPGTLWALPFSAESLKPAGEAFPLVQNAASPSVDNTGTLVYLDRRESGWQLVWRDRSGKKLGSIGQRQESMLHAALSPDGHRVAVSAREKGNSDIRIHEAARPIKTRLTSQPGQELLPIWSPSGNQIAFNSGGNLLRRSADGGGDATVLLKRPKRETQCDWSRDGKYILFLRLDNGGRELWYLSLEEDGSGFEPVHFLQTPFNVEDAKFSPDGRFVAYLSDESGQQELYVRPFPKGDGRWPVSTNGARQAVWSRDGKELFYLEEDTLVAVDVATGPNFSVGSAKKLFQSEHFRPSDSHSYDVSADGQRFVLPERVEGAEPVVRVVQNWYEEFRDREQD